MSNSFPRSRFLALVPLSAIPLALFACGDSGSEATSPPIVKPSADAAEASDAVKSLEASDTSVSDTAVDVCPAGTAPCSSKCVNLSLDHDNCGACGKTCLATEECHAGVCGAAVCDDPCQPEGAKECSGVGLRQCDPHPSLPGCLEWSAAQPCPAGTTCDPATASCRPPCADACAPFSVVLLPDTQYYTSKQKAGDSNSYGKQMKWILAHQKSNNIKFVIHLGDITGSNEPGQWDIADWAHTMLDKGDPGQGLAPVPYSVTPGNHDYLVSGDFDRGGSLFSQHFAKSRFEGKPWYGGAYDSGNTNNYAFFSVGNLQFLVLSLEYSPRKEVLCWAEDILSKHPNHRVIIATHCYLTHGGDYSGGCPDSDYHALGANGGDVWRELASRYSNVFLVVSGHVGDSEFRVKQGNAGNPLNEMLVDYQFEGACDKSSVSACTNNCWAGTFTGNGWMRELVFDPLKNSVQANTFTVENGNKSVFPGGKPALFCSELFKPTDPDPKGANWYSQDPSSEQHTFSFAYDMSSATPYAREDLGKRAFLDRTINSAGAGNQLAPQLALRSTGAFVAVWEDDSSDADGPGNHDIVARGFSPGGCSGFKDITVNTATAGHQQTPSVASDAAGNFVVVWADDQDDNGVFQIHGRGFSPDGTERIPPFVVNSVSDGQQRNPVIAMAPDGRFVVAWEDDKANNGNSQIFLRGFAADGTERFADRSAHSDAKGKRLEPAIGMDSGGGFVVAWQDDSDGNGTYQIHARGFEANGDQRFALLTVNSEDKGQQRNPILGMSEAGAFVVGWEDDQDGDNKFQILARGFQANGTPNLADFRVHTAAAGHHLKPAVSLAPKGDFVFGWQDDQDGNGTYQVLARAFRADGTEWKKDWPINTVASGQQRAPAVALNATGAMVSVWEDDMDSNDAYQLVGRGFDLP